MLESKMIVSKFGGTSMGDAACMLRSAEVAFKQNAHVVVVSATSGTTNELIKITELAMHDSLSKVEECIKNLQAKHLKIASDLQLESKQSEDLENIFLELFNMARGIHLLKECSPRSMDTVLSIGERLSSILFTKAMNTVLKQQRVSFPAQCFDVRNILITDEQFNKARPLQHEINQRCQSLLPHFFNTKGEKQSVMVTQGFIGSTLSGVTTTLGRGGSDYSAAILAEGFKASLLEIWTDVAGIKTTDPRICSKASPIPNISFKEASELATFGAKILHPATLLPAIKNKIPVFVGSSFNPEEGGTWVMEEAKAHPLVRAIALRKKQSLITLTTPEMLNGHGFLFSIFQVFNQHKISIDAVTTSEISVSFTIDSNLMVNKEFYQDLALIGEVAIEENLTLVSLIGNNINHTPGLSHAIFSEISDINVRMICLGASKHNFCFLVSEKDDEETLRRLHKKFLEV